MSSDTLTEGSSEPAHDEGQDGAGQLRRLAIVSADEAAADALWKAIDSRFRRKEKIAVLRSPRGEADVAVYIGWAAGMRDDRAPLKFLIAPAGTKAPAGVALLPGALEEQAKTVTRALRTGATHEQLVEARRAAKPAKEPPAPAKAKPKRKAPAKAKTKKDKPSLEAAAAAAREAAKLAAKELAKAKRAAPEPKKKEKKKAKKPEPSPEEAKAARKAARLAAKEKKPKKPELSPEEAEAAKAARKAAKHAAKERAKAERVAAKAPKPKKPELSPEDIEAAKAARKAAKHAAKEQAKKEKAAKPELSPEEAEAAKAARKAAKHAAKEQAKAERAAKKEKPKKPELSPEEAEAAKAARKAAKREAKASAKAERVAAKQQQQQDISPEEAEAAKAARKAAKKAERRAAKGRDDEEEHEGGEVPPLKLVIVGMSAESAATWGAAVKAGLHDASVEINLVAEEGDVVIRAFEGLAPEEIAAQAAAIGEEDIRCQIFLERLTGDDRDAANRAIARLAAESGGTFLRLGVKFRRFGREGLDLVVESIRGIVAAQFPRRPMAQPPRLVPPDLALARAVAPDALFGQIRYTGVSMPKSTWFPVSQEMSEGFADSKIAIPLAEPIPFTLPIDWAMAIADRRVRQLFKGLEFLSGPIAYWYGKANGSKVEAIGAIDKALKERGTSPNAQLARATQIIVDFIAKQPLTTAPDAWIQNSVERRARVMLAWLLCARTAQKRKLKIDAAAATTIHAHLLDLLELLRADDFYLAGTSDGVQQDCTMIGLALGLRGTAYGNALIAEGLERLKTLQLDIGLTADGVWRDDTYSIHCQILGVLTVMLGDFPPADAAQIEPFAAIAKKMTVFAEAVLRRDGVPPAFDGSKQKAYGARLSAQRRSIARAGGRQAPAGHTPLRNRITDTYVFREAQYFISHSSQKVEAEGGSSLVMMHAEPASAMHGDPGGVVLAFANDDKDVLVRAEPQKGDETASADPMFRNGYRIGGGGGILGTGSARIVKSWRGPGWAAARSIEDNYAQGSVERVVIHLKAMHALVAVDTLASQSGAGFEQFWNIAVGLAPGEQFALAFSDGAEPAIESGEEGSRLRHDLKAGLTASILQWTDGPAEAAIALETTADGWTVRVEGKGLAGELTLAGLELTCRLGG
ncbi:MAG TPA: hypothetical protein VG889_21730 [Rhizomicrobium sp.]|nr:hypothetical protein [Rhizomicrobium sp.]